MAKLTIGELEKAKWWLRWPLGLGTFWVLLLVVGVYSWEIIGLIILHTFLFILKGL